MPLAPLPPPAPRPEGTGGPVDVRLEFKGVSQQYRYYFSEPEFTAPLAEALGACFDEWVDVVVAYDNEELKGHIYVHVVDPRKHLRCAPLVTDAGLDVRPLAPLGKALARYRDALANARDFRLANFRTGLRVVRGVAMCDLWTEGQNPPDGSTFSGCITLNDKDDVCGTDDRDAGLQRIPWPVQRTDDVRACFR
ncbi:MAG: hypothetical protein AAF602_05930 [Myxococcota bacterium]